MTEGTAIALSGSRMRTTTNNYRTKHRNIAGQITYEQTLMMVLAAVCAAPITVFGAAVHDTVVKPVDAATNVSTAPAVQSQQQAALVSGVTKAIRRLAGSGSERLNRIALRYSPQASHTVPESTQATTLAQQAVQLAAGGGFTSPSGFRGLVEGMAPLSAAERAEIFPPFYYLTDKLKLSDTAIDIVRDLPDSGQRAVLLVRFAEAQDSLELLREALADANRAQDEWSVGNAYREIAGITRGNAGWEAILAASQALRNQPGAHLKAIEALVDSEFPRQRLPSLIEAVENIAAIDTISSARASQFTKLAQRFPDEPRLWQRAIDEADKTAPGPDPSQYPHKVLTDLADANPPSYLWKKILDQVARIEDGYYRQSALSSLISKGIPEAQWPTVGALVEGLPEARSRASNYSLMAVVLDASYSDKAFEAVAQIPDSGARLEALRTLVNKRPGTVRERALTEIRRLDDVDEVEKRLALTWSGKPEDWENAIDAIDAFEGYELERRLDRLWLFNPPVSRWPRLLEMAKRGISAEREIFRKFAIKVEGLADHTERDVMWRLIVDSLNVIEDDKSRILARAAIMDQQVPVKYWKELFGAAPDVGR